VIQQVVSRGYAPKHFPDVSGGFCFAEHAFGTRAGKAAPRCSGHFSNPKKRSPAGLVRVFADPLPFRNTLCRSAPARQSASVRRESSCRLAWRRSNEQGRHSAKRGREPTRAIRCKIRPESFAESRPLATASLVPRSSPTHSLPVKVLLISRHAFERVRESVPEVQDFTQAGFALIQRNDSRLLRN